MKKRNIQRWIKRVSCRVGALLSICFILATMVVPAFASNNASTQKWVVAESRQMTNEQGTLSTYFRLTPYVGGSVYAAYIQSYVGRFVFNSSSPSSSGTNLAYSYYLYCYNYPSWWRSAIPLGGLSYLQLDVDSITAGNTASGPWSPVSSAAFYVFDSDNRLNISLNTDSFSEAGYSWPSGSVSSAVPPPVFVTYGGMPNGSTFLSSSVSIEAGGSYTVALNGLANIIPAWPSISQPVRGISWGQTYLYNLSSDRLVFGASVGDYKFSRVAAKLSFWVGANKLPAGLQVGDEFPANTDAFDDLRDDLIKQFPEISENVEDGKDTINGWNDTETVGSDVAESSLTVINGLFQNLGQFLAVVSLMIFGAVCLRMLIKKAVSG